MLTDNGNPLDAGTYTLNNQGYFEDYAIHLNAGNHTVQAQYSGDTSFNASTTNQTITITPAVTSIIPSVPPFTIVGQSFTIGATVFTQSYGLAPSGTVTFLADGNVLPGTVQLTPFNGNYPSPASLSASLSVTFNTPGTHVITATYNGDTNYTSATSFAANTDVRYNPGYFTLTANPQNVMYGNSLTLTAIVGGSSKTVAPTGQISFINASGTMSQPTYTTITDNNGFLAMQAVVTLTPLFIQSPFAMYFGDTNYASTQSNSVDIGITDATFSIDPIQNVTIGAPGQSGFATVILTPSNGFVGDVAISCALPANMTEATCPSTSLHIFPNVQASTQLTITTRGPHQVAGTRPVRIGYFGFALVAGLFFVAIPRSRRKLASAILLLMLTALVVSCGGGGGGGAGHTDPGTPPGTYTATVTATAPGITQTSTFSVTVQ
jgi:hypothetical protein